MLEKSNHTVMSKSPNKQHHLCFEARPLEGHAKAMDEGRIDPRYDPKVCSKILAEFGWDKDLAKKIWCFGPENTRPNMVVDMCKGVHHLNEIKDSIITAFQWATKEGALTEENLRGIAFEVCDVVLHVVANLKATNKRRQFHKEIERKGYGRKHLFLAATWVTCIANMVHLAQRNLCML
ncbi:hypothetical protein L7F22_069461 [Adiantum nelumboides]|nr:hypothetical protein [Adiantum nelumboides]MCO5615172.1 hypothetical protein [Adiantum nelumboides]